jgi:hypothetical protein
MSATLEPGQTWMVLRGPNVGALVTVSRGPDGGRILSGMNRGRPLELVPGEDELGPVPAPRERSFAELLADFDAAYLRAAPLRHARLKAGLAAAELAPAFARRGLTMPAEYGLLHEWRDGFDRTDEGWTDEHEPDGWYSQIPLTDLGDTLLAHEEVVADLDQWSELREDFARRGRPCHFRRGFVPLLQIQSHGYVVIDMLGSFGGRPGQILEFDYMSQGTSDGGSARRVTGGASPPHSPDVSCEAREAESRPV